MIVHGGSIATLTALLAARQAQAGFDVWRDGAHAGPPLALLTSDQTHYSTSRAAADHGLRRGRRDRGRDRRALPHATRGAGRRDRRRARARPAPDRRRRDRGHDVHGRVRPARGDRRHLRRRGAVAARRRRARCLGRAQPCARATARRHRPRRLGGLGSPQDPAVPGARIAARVRARAGCLWGVRRRRPTTSSAPTTPAPRTWARARSSARGRSSRWWPTSVSPPSAATACGCTSSGSGSWARVLAELVRESGDFELALEPECNIVCFRHRAPTGPTPTRCRSASAARSTRAGATTSCRRGCAASPGCAAR